MKFDISRKTMTWGLIGISVIILVIFITYKLLTRSSYKWPNTSEDTTFTLSGTPSFAVGPPALVTFATTAAHGFTAGDMVIISSTTALPVGASITPSAGKGVAGSGPLTNAAGFKSNAVVTNVFYVGPVDTVTTNGFTVGASSFAAGTGVWTAVTVESIARGIKTPLNSNLISCQNQYSSSMISNPGGESTHTTTRTACITSNVNPYVTTHCPWLTATNIPTLAIDPAAKAAYDQYQTDQTFIQQAYVAIYNRALTGTISGCDAGTSANQQTVVVAARKADMSGAARKYLATACPGFAVSGDGTTTNDTAYKAWTTKSDAVVAGVAAPSAISSAPATAPVFWAPPGLNNGITDATLLEWVEYAGSVSWNAGSSSLVAASGGLSTTIKSTLASKYLYTRRASSGTQYDPNWRLAYNAGPGTYPRPFWNSDA